jgi:hypothetical protein
MADLLDEAEIENALKKRLYDASLGLAISWPNFAEPDTVRRPFLEVRFPGSERVGGSLKGAATIQRIEATMAVIVVVDENSHTSTANGYAMDVATAFEEGTRIAIEYGEICLGMPDVKKGFEAKGEWRVPVIIPYTASNV